ncbi:radical SAM protein [Hydrogenoanaerobacterium sp.]|uniref:radical SAM/SPASM domain-containing protein n=1 Tax=Hydrogenoanaerobacterium sp. TaxID=2953763 RepID=UPI00289A6679|nr:radical SAM protein [Hydrogenoanaerobacterium sp.]
MTNYKKAYIEITNVCNLSCNFCPKTTRTPTFMTSDQFAQLARQVKPFTDYVYLHLMGEPLLHPQLDEILKICEILDLKVTITTNGTLINKKRELLLKSPCLYKVHFSLHSFEANDSGIALEDYVRDIVDFARCAADEGTINVLRLWNMDSAELKGSNRLNKDIIDLLEAEFGCVFSLRNALGQGRSGIKLLPRIYLEMAQKFQWPSLNAPVMGDEVFCYGLRDQFGILADGTVVPCCLDSEGTVDLGNAFDAPLKTILLSRRAERIYEGFTARKAAEQLCARCGYAQRYIK